jgi:hypothetical protein
MAEQQSTLDDITEIEDLLIQADSVCSLILYREPSGLSEQTKIDLRELVTKLRVRSDRVTRARRLAGGS